jgi:hypothetical protein
MREGSIVAQGRAARNSNRKAAVRRVQPVEDRFFTTLMEQLQEGYVSSIAAAAGCTAEPIRRDIYGFDVRLIKPTPPGTEEVTLLAQLKNTTTVKPDPNREFFSYQLKKREYLEDLAVVRSGPKAVLLVMVTSPVQNQWTDASHEYMTVRHCCYWSNLEGHPVDNSVASPTVRVPIANIFDSQALSAMMDRLSRGEPL